MYLRPFQDDASEYWRCPRKPPYCPGRACVRTGWQVDAFGNQFKEGRVRETAERLREEASSDFPTSSRNIIREVRADLPIEVRAASAPSPSNMRWNYNYAKRKHQEETSPRWFSQLYTLSVIIEHCSVPCVYALLPNKTLLTYTRFFRAIRDAMPAGWQPIRIMSDFERAAISAANEIFPNSTSTGCLFHFGNALFRRIQHLPNLFTRFREDENTRMALRSVQALAFVPLEFVYNYFCLVMSPLEPIADLQDFIMYFINTWIGARQIIENEPILEANQGGAADAWIRGRIIALNLANSNATFPRELWNVVDRVAAGIGRTNNSVLGTPYGMFI
ncbi:hypothetical protein niasHS_007079 [Heterodera schachtii]|uniref:MULE transposase domain-containing protein n=1 Tax=Heterodera schachtii TaxID=97005 RepID=A0ABD2JFL7_HETSC